MHARQGLLARVFESKKLSTNRLQRVPIIDIAPQESRQKYNCSMLLAVLLKQVDHQVTPTTSAAVLQSSTKLLTCLGHLPSVDDNPIPKLVLEESAGISPSTEHQHHDSSRLSLIWTGF